MKAKYDYRYLGIWMCCGNIIQFISNTVGEDRIKSIRSGKLWIFMFIIAIPMISFALGKSDIGMKFEKYIKSSDKLLTWCGNICMLLRIIYAIYLV